MHFTWHGEMVRLTPEYTTHGPGAKPIGYTMLCPQCGGSALISVGLLNRPKYTVLSSGPLQENVTIRPDLPCPHQCGWHVIVTSGVAQDVIITDSPADVMDDSGPD